MTNNRMPLPDFRPKSLFASPTLYKFQAMLPPPLLSPAPPPMPLLALPSLPAANHPSPLPIQNCRGTDEFKPIHCHLIKTGIIRDTQLQNSVISMFANGDAFDMSYARRVFDQIPQPSLFAWNSMIKGYSRRNSPELAVSLYMEMLQKGVRADDYTFPFLLKGFTRDMAFRCTEEFHAQIIKLGFACNSFVQNALIHTYALGGKIESARELFDNSARQDTITWNAMISGYNKVKQYERSLRLFEEMARENVVPTPVTIVSVLSACTKVKDLKFGKWVHGFVERNNMENNLRLENALIDMYATCGEMEVALGLFNSMKVKDVISWTAMVTGFTNLGQVDKAREIFDKMPEKDFVSWTAMIDGYLQAHRYKEALEIFRGMQAANIRPDEFTMVSILTACAQLGALEVGEWIRVYIEKNNIKTDIYVGNALIDMYSKCGSIDNAVEVFEQMPQKDKFTWTSIIGGLANNGHGEKALNMFNQMLSDFITPDEVTYVGVLSACTHSGMVDKGKELFSNMKSRHGVVPNVAHYGCMVDLLGRAGQLEEALEIIKKMPVKPNSIVWGALLGACRVHKNVKLAEIAAKGLLELEPQNGAVYVLLSNVYAVCNRLEDARKVRKMMMERGIRKIPGCSLIEKNGVVHEFVAGDRSHQLSDDIYLKLKEMLLQIKLAGYVPDKGEVLLDIGEEDKENAIYWHSEKIAIAFGLIDSRPGATIRIVKNLRMCTDCHRAMKFISEVYGREIVIRDRTRFHHFRQGSCTCKDYW